MFPRQCLQDMSSRRLQDMYSRRLQEMSSRRLEGIFTVTIFRLPRRLQDVFEDKKLLRSRHVEDVLKTSLKPTNVCWVVSVINFEKSD